MNEPISLEQQLASFDAALKNPSSSAELLAAYIPVKGQPLTQFALKGAFLVSQKGGLAEAVLGAVCSFASFQEDPENNKSAADFAKWTVKEAQIRGNSREEITQAGLYAAASVAELNSDLKLVALDGAVDAAQEGSLHEVDLGIAYSLARLEKDPECIEAAKDFAYWKVTEAQLNEMGPDEVARAGIAAAAKIAETAPALRANALNGAFTAATENSVAEAILGVAYHTQMLKENPGNTYSASYLATWRVNEAIERKLPFGAIVLAGVNVVKEIAAMDPEDLELRRAAMSGIGNTRYMEAIKSALSASSRFGRARIVVADMLIALGKKIHPWFSSRNVSGL